MHHIFVRKPCDKLHKEKRRYNDEYIPNHK